MEMAVMRTTAMKKNRVDFIVRFVCSVRSVLLKDSVLPIFLTIGLIAIVLITPLYLVHFASRFAPRALASMSSSNYEIQFGNVNMTSGSKSGGPYKVTDTVGQTAPGKYGTTGYIV